MTIAAPVLFERTIAASMGGLSLHRAGSHVWVFAALILGRADHGIPLSRMAASDVWFHERQGSGAQARAGRQ